MNPRPAKIPWTNIRWLTALMGAGLLIVGQVQIAGGGIKADGVNQLGDWLTETIHLGIPQINQILYGIPILLAGGVLLAISLRGLTLLPFRPEAYAEEGKTVSRFLRSAWPWLAGGLIPFSLLLGQLWNLNYGWYSPILWITPLLIFGGVLARLDREQGVDLSPHLSRKDLLWITGLLLAGLLIATYRLQGWPDQLIGDEGNFWTIARDIARGELRPSIFGNGVYSFPILSSFVQAWTMRLFGINLWGWRMASVLPGVLTVVPLYLLGRDLFNRKAAILSTILLITSPYFLAFARLGYNNIQALFITVLTLYWLYQGLRRNSHFLTFLAGIAAGMGFYTYFGARGILLTAIAFIALLWLTRKIHFRRAIASSGILLLAALLTIAPYLIYGFHQDAQTMGFKTFESVFFNVFNGSQYYSEAELFKYAPVIHLGGNELFFNPVIYTVLMAQGVVRTLLAFQNHTLITEHFIAFPLAGTIGVIFYLLGIGITLKHIKEPRYQLLILWFLTYILGFSALNTVPPRQTHMVALIPALAVLTGLGILACGEAIQRAVTNWKGIGNAAMTILVMGAAIGGLYDYFGRAPREYRPQPDQIISWAGLDSHGESFIYVYQNPSFKDFKPYIMEEFLQSIPYKTVSLTDATSGTVKFLKDARTLVFAPPEIAANVIQVLERQWSSSLIQRVFTSTDGTVVLAAGMNMPFVFERDRPLLSTFLDAFQHIPLNVTLVLFLLTLGLTAFLPAALFESAPAWARRWMEWLRRSAQTKDEPEPTEELLPVLEEGDISASASPPEALPDWAMQLLHSSENVSTKRWIGKVRSTSSAEGRDFFIHFHIPTLKITLPWSRLPERLRIDLPPVHFPNSLLLILAVVLAFGGQLAILRHWFIPGVLLYGMCGVGLFIWSRRNPKWMDLFTGQIRISPRAEILLAGGLLLVIAFTRFYDLGYRVYGLEADESKWTVQSWFSTILHVQQGDFSTLHYQYLPVSFWVRSIFLRLFGLNFLSARIESAFLSLASAVLFYLLVRRLTTSPAVAWLSMGLYSLSFVELSASHQALHNTTVEVWIMAGLFLFILALQERKWWQIQLAGIVLGLGMLTYETFFPTPLLAGACLLGVAIARIVKKKEPLLFWLKHFLIFAWPIILVFFVYIQKYMASQAFQFATFNQATAHGTNLSGLVQFLARNSNALLKTLFVKVVWTDSLVYWDGPFLNPWLIAFMVIGLIYNLLNLRKPFFFFIPLWFLFNALYAPILVGAVWPRVLYTSLGPLIVWAAMGLLTTLAVLRAWFEGLKLKYAGPVFILLIAAILVKDYRIFTGSLLDPLDRQKRRELATLTAESTASVPMVLLPYEPNQNDAVFVESHVLLFSAAGNRRTGLEAEKYYKALPFDQLLPALHKDRQLESVDLIFDKTANNMVEERDQGLKILLRCYPVAILQTSGKFFDVYHLDQAALTEPVCYQGTAPEAVVPEDGVSLQPPGPDELEWDPHEITPTSAAITLERKTARNYWIEVEDHFAGPGWSASSEFVNGFNGNGFLFDNWDAGRAQYSVDLNQAGTYRVWVRSYKRVTNDQVNSILIGGRETEFASNANLLNEWVWDDMGTYSLPAGNVPIELRRQYGKDQEYSVFIDTILLTQDRKHPPDQIVIWEKVLDTGPTQGTASHYSLPEELPPGEYRWTVRLFDGNKLIDSTGAQGMASKPATFIITDR